MLAHAQHGEDQVGGSVKKHEAVRDVRGVWRQDLLLVDDMLAHAQHGEDQVEGRLGLGWTPKPLNSGHNPLPVATYRSSTPGLAGMSCSLACCRRTCFCCCSMASIRRAPTTTTAARS